jgi:hypothetical protein
VIVAGASMTAATLVKIEGGDSDPIWATWCTSVRAQIFRMLTGLDSIQIVELAICHFIATPLRLFLIATPVQAILMRL